ncbi:MAG: thiolase family protein [Candidatus Omnitrophica bacterium]|nr:thiolase family protein [Candidatus Omnitrophota bacterium]
MERIAIVDGIRTPFCKMGTSFNDLSAQELGRIAARELIERTSLDVKNIDEVIFGCVGQPADAANIARVITLLAGIPKTTPAFTVHRNCASGIEAVVNAAIKIQAGEGRCILAGGTESMSNIPFLFSKAAQEIFMELGRAKTTTARLQAFLKFRLQHFSPRIGLQLGLTDPVCGLNMGQTAEVLVKEFGITRREQDEFSLLSHLRVIANRAILREEIVPVIPGPKYKEAIVDDNGPREGQTYDALAKLKPFFERETGTVTAGNSSQITDGAVALLVICESRARELGFKPLGFIRAFAFAGVEPHRMGIGPAHAIPKVLKKAGLKLSDMQAIEINEAFAAQVLACLKSLASDKFTKDFGYEGYTGEIDPAKLNVNGGAIALGHPVGATGARLILTMLKHLNRHNFNLGLVSLCVGGGQGAAVILER